MAPLPDAGVGHPTEETAVQSGASAPPQPAQKVEVIVIGDVYWDTVVVPYSARNDNIDNVDVRRLGRVDRRAGSWLLERFIRQGRVQITEPMKRGWQKKCHDENIDKETQEKREREIDEQIKVFGYLKPSESKGHLEANEWWRAVTRVKLFPKGIGGDGEQQVYRMEHGYGWIESCVSPTRDEYQSLYGPVFSKLNTEIEKRTPNDDQTPLRIVVINDDNRIFRHLKTSGDIIERIARPSRDWLVFATTDPFGTDPVWTHHVWKVIKDRQLYGRTAVVVSSAALRSQGHNTPQGVAIETEAYDLWRHVRSSPLLKNLMECQHVLVRDRDGVFHFNKEKKEEFDYYFRPFETGMEFFNPGRYGVMSGYEKILIASIVKEMLVEAVENPPASDLFARIDEGICFGLRLWARHFEIGLSYHKFPESYLNVGKDDEETHPFDHLFKLGSTNEQSNGIEKDNKKDKGPEVAWVQFPFSRLAQIPGSTEERLKTWSRVEWFREEVKKKQGKFNDCLAEVVGHGLDKAVEKYSRLDKATGRYKEECGTILCPVARFGKLEAVDKEEIDAFLDIYYIILKYLEDDTWKTPLSLAVFGPPGTGKSFAVEEILKAARSSTARAGSGDPLVCNLAQFTKPENLTTAFHQAQDRALSEEVPLIFFDEFDANFANQEYGWLKYFLAPMQDGKFKGADTEASYRVGKAIFAFAGGTAKTFAEFKDNLSEKAAKNAKGPDFISRLRGYLNIKGINKKEGENSVSDLLALRRAVILRSLLVKKAKQIFDEPGKNARIDKRLINAFLWIDSYEHGIRSMEAIVDMARPEQGELRVASLPSRDQLRMHVNDEKFLKLTAIEAVSSL